MTECVENHNNWQPFILLLIAGCFLTLCQELDNIFLSVFPFMNWKFGFIFSVIALIYARMLFKKAEYTEPSFFRSVTFNFVCVCAIFIVLLLILPEIIFPAWGNALRRNGLDINVIAEEIIEAFCFLPLFLLSLKICFRPSGILSRFCAKYGKDVELEVLIRREIKSVFNSKTSSGEFILTVIPNISIVRFFKYSISQGIQQRLYEENMDVAKMEYSYLHDGFFVYVQQKIEGSNSFPRTNENMYKMGEVFAKLHSVTNSIKYSIPFMYVKHPNVFIQAFIYIRAYLLRTIFSCIYYSFYMRKFPKGICHRDVNERNIIMRPDGPLMLIDFDAHRYQPFVEGLVRFYTRHCGDEEKFSFFMKGYNSVRPLTDLEKKYLEKELSIKLEL